MHSLKAHYQRLLCQKRCYCSLSSCLRRNYDDNNSVVHYSSHSSFTPDGAALKYWWLQQISCRKRGHFFAFFSSFPPQNVQRVDCMNRKEGSYPLAAEAMRWEILPFFSNELLGNAGSHHSFTSGFTSTLKAKRVYTLYPIGNFKLPFNQSPEHFYRSLAYISYKHCLSRQKAD